MHRLYCEANGVAFATGECVREFVELVVLVVGQVALEFEISFFHRLILLGVLGLVGVGGFLYFRFCRGARGARLMGSLGV